MPNLLDEPVRLAPDAVRSNGTADAAATVGPNGNQRQRILLVEDERSIIRFLERALTALGYELHVAETGEDGIAQAAAKPIDLVLLDIGLPAINGHAVLARIREHKPHLPILMLTARDSVEDKVSALNGGADDYLTKPFALDELVARIKVLTRRVVQQQPSVLRAGSLEMDLSARQVRRGGTPVELSNREFALLEYFIRHPGQDLSRKRLLTACWRLDYVPDSNVVDVYVRYLRRKIDPKGSQSCITTVRGTGYRFDVTPEL